jgi:GTPase
MLSSWTTSKMTNGKTLFVAIVGRPNVGKSTLLNKLVNTKVSITSSKPQTTRNRITGILTEDGKQYVFVDTPGMHKGKDLLNKRIDKTAVGALADVDAVLFVTDRPLGLAEKHVIRHFQQIDCPVILVINKIDLLETKTDIDRLILSYMGSYPFEAVIPVSATGGTHLERIKDALDPFMTEGPLFYPEEMKSDQSKTQMMSELIREKILFHTEQEVPHAVAVTIESLEENEEDGTLDVSALILVERPTQKQILIGKGGEKMKRIGTEARKDINKTLDLKVHLTLWVKVKKDWRNRPSDLNALGYGE